ncbi:hypothetical protein JHK87_022268 [Glycine soja]|nr:hypothetical protein JHK87_022268 [Glycine soja]
MSRVPFKLGLVLMYGNGRCKEDAGNVLDYVMKILLACDEGAKIVKIYPVSALGEFQYISTLKKAFPHISMVASHGITIGMAILFLILSVDLIYLLEAAVFFPLRISV